MNSRHFKGVKKQKFRPISPKITKKKIFENLFFIQEIDRKSLSVFRSFAVSAVILFKF